MRAMIEWDEEAQAYPATCLKLNFVSSSGDTQEAAIANLQEATKLILEPLPESLK
ncbi:MAG: hypothetical protein NZ482_07060 [Gloeomargarita sp. SKYG98]|nr:hypothetical protein [Gloeomargarita sp. SKYG98]